MRVKFTSCLCACQAPATGRFALCASACKLPFPAPLAGICVRHAPGRWMPCAPRLPGVPFRDTHHLSGAAVKMAEERGCSLFDLMPEDLRGIHPLFADDVAEARSPSFATSI